MRADVRTCYTCYICAKLYSDKRDKRCTYGQPCHICMHAPLLYTTLLEARVMVMIKTWPDPYP